MFSTRLRPVCRYDVDVGQIRSNPELVSKSQVVADERAHSEGLTVGHDCDCEELHAGRIVLILADITERVDLGIALYLAGGLATTATLRSHPSARSHCAMEPTSKLPCSRAWSSR